MKKKMLVIMSVAIFIIGITTVGYAKVNSRLNNSSYRGTMMSQRNINSNTYNKMIELMKNNGLEAGINAMESRNLNAMSNFMNNITNDQYKQMIDIMNGNGYGVMARRMGSVNRQDMVNIHSSMMGR